MYRVVLVDDETIIVEGLRRVVKWADTAHFARTFKKLENMSANEYRNSLIR